jgi:hypothetical protein
MKVKQHKARDMARDKAGQEETQQDKDKDGSLQVRKND